MADATTYRFDLRKGTVVRETTDSLVEFQGRFRTQAEQVFAEEGEHFCFVSDAEVRKRTVTVGLNNAHYVVILDGLEGLREEG